MPSFSALDIAAPFTSFSNYAPQNPSSPGGLIGAQVTRAFDASPSLLGTPFTLGGAAIGGAFHGALTGAGIGGVVGMLGGPVGAVGGAAIGAIGGAGIAVGKKLIDQSLSLVTIWKSLGDTAMHLARNFSDFSGKLARVEDAWVESNLRIREKWAAAIENITSKMGTRAIQYNERWENIKIQIFKEFEPLLNKMLDYLSRIADWAFKILDYLPKILGTLIDTGKLIMALATDIATAPSRGFTGAAKSAGIKFDLSQFPAENWGNMKPPTSQQSPSTQPKAPLQIPYAGQASILPWMEKFFKIINPETWAGVSDKESKKVDENLANVLKKIFPYTAEVLAHWGERAEESDFIDRGVLGIPTFGFNPSDGGWTAFKDAVAVPGKSPADQGWVVEKGSRIVYENGSWRRIGRDTPHPSNRINLPHAATRPSTTQSTTRPTTASSTFSGLAEAHGERIERNAGKGVHQLHHLDNFAGYQSMDRSSVNSRAVDTLHHQLKDIEDQLGDPRTSATERYHLRQMHMQVESRLRERGEEITVSRATLHGASSFFRESMERSLKHFDTAGYELAGMNARSVARRLTNLDLQHDIADWQNVIMKGPGFQGTRGADALEDANGVVKAMQRQIGLNNRLDELDYPTARRASTRVRIHGPTTRPRATTSAATTQASREHANAGASTQPSTTPAATQPSAETSATHGREGQRHVSKVSSAAHQREEREGHTLNVAPTREFREAVYHAINAIRGEICDNDLDEMLMAYRLQNEGTYM